VLHDTKARVVKPALAAHGQMRELWSHRAETTRKTLRRLLELMPAYD